MATNWRTYGQDTVVARLDPAEVPGFLRKQIAVEPNEAAVVLRQGRVEQVVTADQVQVAGFWDGLKSLVGGGLPIEVVFVDLSPIEATVYLGARTESAQSQRHESRPLAGGAQTRESVEAAEVVLTALSRDKEVVTAECRLRLRVRLDDARVAVGLLKGRAALASWDVVALVRSELVGPVLLPLVAAHDAAEFRGSTAARDTLVATARQQLGLSLAALGFTLDRFTVAWGLTEVEREQIARNRAGREESEKDFACKRRLAELNRAREAEKTRLINEQEVKALEARGEAELAQIYQAAQADRSMGAKELEGRIRSLDLAIEREAASVRLELEQQRARAALETERNRALAELELQERQFKLAQEARLAAIQADDAEMAGMVRMQIQMATAKHDRELATRRLEIEAAHTQRREQLEADHRGRKDELDARYQERQAKLEESLARMGMIKDILTAGLPTGAVTADVLKTLLEQSTEQEYATATDEKVRARAAGAAAQHNLETFKQAEDRERAHQAQTTRLATDLMQSAKQAPGPTVIAGPGAQASPSATPPPPLNVIQVPATPSPSPAPAAPGPRCPACGMGVEAAWKNCPHCGQALGAAARHCAHCGETLEAGWKACPKCGRKIGQGTCSACGAPVQPQWKACPQCGQPLGGAAPGAD